MSRRLSDYHYDLPPELIADRPVSRRDASRMLVLDPVSGRFEHRLFSDFPSYLESGDLVVLNDSRVIKARLLRESPAMEIFLLESLGDRLWKCLVRPGRKLRTGDSVEIAGTRAHVREVLPDGERVVFFETPPDLEVHGHLPLPPYFQRPADARDEDRYQTIYARQPGSVAAPTAGLHFTPEILARIPHAFLTLHVGAGTFLPVKSDDIADHRMHEEHYSIPPETAEAIENARRLVAIGTTVTRVLESQPPGPIRPCSGSTRIFLHPPKRLQRAGMLLTNFHLPGSTLLMLVSAMAGRETILTAYQEAIRERYRFFSYGDCMLILGSQPSEVDGKA